MFIGEQYLIAVQVDQSMDSQNSTRAKKLDMNTLYRNMKQVLSCPTIQSEDSQMMSQGLDAKGINVQYNPRY